MTTQADATALPDERGRYGPFGGRFVPETLMTALGELERAREDGGDDDALQAEIAFKLGAIHEFERRYRRAVQEYELHIHHGKRAGTSGSKARSRIRHIIEHAYED